MTPQGNGDYRRVEALILEPRRAESWAWLTVRSYQIFGHYLSGFANNATALPNPLITTPGWQQNRLWLGNRRAVEANANLHGLRLGEHFKLSYREYKLPYKDKT